MATIFLVEDNPADVELFRMALDEACVKCNLEVFEDGSRAMEGFSGGDSRMLVETPDLIVLDLNLPKNDGLEVLRFLRETPKFANVPVAVLSSSCSSRERAKLSDFRVCEFIVKPPDLDAYMGIGQIIGGLLTATREQQVAV